MLQDVFIVRDDVQFAPKGSRWLFEDIHLQALMGFGGPQVSLMIKPLPGSEPTNKLFETKEPPLGKPESDTVFVHRLGGYGDILNSFLFLERLKKRGKRIIYGAAPIRGKLIENCSFIDEIVYYPYPAKYWEENKVISLENYPEWSLDHSLRLYSQKFGVDFNALMYNINNINLGLPTPKEPELLRSLKERMGKKIILISPRASAIHRSLSGPSMEYLVSLLDRSKYLLVTIKDSIQMEGWEQLFDVILTAPPIDETLAWINASELIISVDTFTAHLALIAKKPLLLVTGSFPAASRYYWSGAPLWVMERNTCANSPCNYHGGACPLTNGHCVNLNIDSTIPIAFMLEPEKANCMKCGKEATFVGGRNYSRYYYCPDCNILFTPEDTDNWNEGFWYRSEARNWEGVPKWAMTAFPLHKIEIPV